MPRIGVFVCHCGHNIAGIIDIPAVIQQLAADPDVAFAVDYKYMCSDPGQALIKESITKYQLDGVVVAACSPSMHETTFRRTVASAGLNPYRCESANIREQVSWVHQQEKEAATQKALEIASSIVEKVGGNEELASLTLPLTKRLLVIGGGISGMQTALDVADAGYPVVLVELAERIGGKMARLSGTYLNFAAAPDLLRQRVERVTSHPNIQVLTQAEVKEVNGYVGNFQARVQVKEGQEEAPLEFLFDVGAITVASGWESYPLNKLAEYGGGELPDVIDALTFEGMLAPGAEIRRPSDGKVPQEIVFVQCAGSRDPERGVAYCSKVCCMVVAKQAMLYRPARPRWAGLRLLHRYSFSREGL